MFVGAATRTGISRTSRAELGDARQLRRATGQDDAGRQLPDAGRADLVAQQLERLAHPRLDDLADLEPADGPSGLLAEDADADLLVVADRLEVRRAVADLELLGDLRARS